MPPVPPAVASQQAPPLRQFAQGAAGQGQPDQGAGGQVSPDALLGSLVDQAGKILTKIAQIASQTKPELIPILKQAVQALVMFAGKIKAGGGQQGQPGQPGQQPPDGGNQGTAQDGAPDSGGGAAMGMPQ